MDIFLASESKRRQELLTALGLKYQIIPSQIEEKLEPHLSPEQQVKQLSLQKALAAKNKIKVKRYIIISADTVVALKNRILGKPKNRKEAGEMLISLRSKQHRVLTGLTFLNHLAKVKTTVVKTSVCFGKISQRQINEYLDQKFYLDRAGAYGIQDPKFNYVKGYIGSYTNILGLPLEKLVKLLKEFGVTIKFSFR